jgi:hypothetical protein
MIMVKGANPARFGLPADPATDEACRRTAHRVVTNRVIVAPSAVQPEYLLEHLQ